MHVYGQGIRTRKLRLPPRTTAVVGSIKRRVFCIMPDHISRENLFAGVDWVPVYTRHDHRHVYPSSTGI